MSSLLPVHTGTPRLTTWLKVAKSTEPAGGSLIHLGRAPNFQGMPPNGRSDTGTMLAELSQTWLETDDEQCDTSGRGGGLKTGFCK